MVTSNGTARRAISILTGLVVASLPAASAAAQGVRMLPGARVETHSKGAWNVEAVDLDLDGVLDLVTQDGDPQKGFLVLLGRPDGTFESGVSYAGPTNESFAFADFTGDGFPDLVTGDFNPDPPLGVWVYPSVGDGSFGPPVISPLPSGSPNTTELAPGDFDGDGGIDLVVRCVGFAQVLRIGHGNGDGSFGPFLSFGSDVFGAVVAADLDLDGRLDVIEGSQLKVRLGKGDGTFQPPIVNGVGFGSIVLVTDLDGDGLPDTVSGSGGDFRVHLGQGDGTLVQIGQYNSGTLEGAMALADLDGDGRLDLLAVRPQHTAPLWTDPGLTVRLGLPDEAFGPSIFYRTGGEPSQLAVELAVGDFDHDGAVDAALGQYSLLADSSPPDIGLAFGRGDGTFDVPDVVELLAHPLATELADMNGDGHLDLVSTVQASLPAVRIALGHGDGSFDPPVGVDVGANAGELAVADLDGDGVLDLVVAGDPPGATVAALGSGDGVTFGTAQLVATSDVVDVRVGQLDDDDAPDIAVARAAEGVITIYHGDGKGGFGADQYLSAGGFPNALVLADLNGDGRVDIATADSDGVVGLLENLGGGNFANPQPLPAPGNPLRIVSGDFDRDGLVDLATVHNGPKRVSVFLGTGGGGFAPALFTGLGHTSRWMGTADVNHDGLLDLVNVHAIPSTFFGNEDEMLGKVSLLLGRGDGSFVERRLFFSGANPLDGSLGDVDEDGFPDVAVAGFESQEAWLLRNLSGPWEDLGFALAAPAGAPHLSGSGVPTGTEHVTLLVTGLPAGTPGLLYVGLDTLAQPFKGGILLPVPTLSFQVVAQVELRGRWSPAIPPGTAVYFQAWFSVPPGGDIAATNALLTIGE